MPEVEHGDPAVDALGDHLAVVLRQPLDLRRGHDDVDHRGLAGEAQSGFAGRVAAVLPAAGLAAVPDAAAGLIPPPPPP